MHLPETENLRHIIDRARVIALVGASLNPERASHQVGQYLSDAGFRVIAVNPGHAGTRLFGEEIRASLRDCPPEVDLVDVFRRPDHIPAIVEEALAHLPNLRTIWLQLGISHPAAASLARARGVDVVEDRCLKIDHAALFHD